MLLVKLRMHKPRKINNARGYKPTSKVWLICLRVNLHQIKFDYLFTAEKALSWVLVKYLGVRNQVAKCHLTFRGFKIKILYL